MSWNCSNVKQNQTKDSFTYSKTGKADSCCTCTLNNDVSEETSDQICETEMFPGKTQIELLLNRVYQEENFLDQTTFSDQVLYVEMFFTRAPQY